MGPQTCPHVDVGHILAPKMDPKLPNMTPKINIISQNSPKMTTEMHGRLPGPVDTTGREPCRPQTAPRPFQTALPRSSPCRAALLLLLEQLTKIMLRMPLYQPLHNTTPPQFPTSFLSTIFRTNIRSETNPNTTSTAKHIGGAAVITLCVLNKITFACCLNEQGSIPS